MGGTTFAPLDDVLGFLSSTLHGADFTVRDSGVNGYTKTYTTLYGLRVYTNQERPEMGTHIIADGNACESLGYKLIQFIYHGLLLRLSRLDLAVDHCPFTPEELHKHWLKDDVRTACKPARNPKPGREGIRTHTWYSSPTGDTLNMGSRQSTAFARCYNERGFTRFELELKSERAEKAAGVVFEDPDTFQSIVLGLVQEFVDFVDAKSDTNRSRCLLLPFWKEFVEGGKRIKILMQPRPELTIGRLIDWIEGQVAPSLALYEIIKEATFKRDVHRRELRIIGLKRLKKRHRALLRDNKNIRLQHI